MIQSAATSFPAMLPHISAMLAYSYIFRPVVKPTLPQLYLPVVRVSLVVTISPDLTHYVVEADMSFLCPFLFFFM